MDAVGDLAGELVRLPDRGTYLKAASELLSKLFPCDGLAWNELDMQQVRAEVYARPGNHPFGDLARKLLEFRNDHPLVTSALGDSMAGVWRPRRLSDIVSDREFHESRLYREGFREMRINRQLSLRTALAGPGTLHSWVMNRWNQDFSDREMDLAREIQPLLCLLDTAYSQPPPTATNNPWPADEFGLTDREAEILALVAQGLKSTAVGHLLGISPRTVSKHLEHSYSKLRCTNRVDAVRLFTAAPSRAPGTGNFSVPA